MITKDVIIPPDSELTVEEVNLSSTALRTASFHLGKYCEEQNHEYMLCGVELQDPRKCINEGKAVTACSLEFFRLLKKTCLAEFNQHASCIFKSSGDYAFDKCRMTQGIYDKCVLENMNIERPAYGYYTRARVHNTTRPKPTPPPKVVYEDASDALPADAVKTPAKYGSREHFVTE